MTEPTKPVMQSPVLTSKNLPTPPVMEKVLADSDIEAKPLRAPNFINLKPKNPNMSLYWGNRSVGERESGMRYDQLITMGFVPAKPEQVMTLEGKDIPPSIVRDGRIMMGDIILLIIPRADYVGATKWNEQSARRRVKKPGVAISGATQEADSRLQPGSVLPQHPKISTYVPQLAEVDAKTADNSGPQVNLAEK
jgi:hypothetical protein